MHEAPPAFAAEPAIPGRRDLQWSLSWHAPPGVGAVPRPGSGNEQAAKKNKKKRNVVNITRPAMTTAVGGAGAEGGGTVRDDRAHSAAGVRWAPG